MDVFFQLIVFGCFTHSSPPAAVGVFQCSALYDSGGKTWEKVISRNFMLLVFLLDGIFSAAFV